MNRDILFATIESTISKIHDELNRLTRKSIFFAPELYISFCIGQEILNNKTKIFGAIEDIEWERETAIQNYGIFDIGFKINGIRKIVIELKLIDKGEKYKKDIERLQSLNGEIAKFFCVLLDSKKEIGKDDRIITLKKETGLDPIYKVRISGEAVWHPRLQNGKYYCDLLIYEI